MEFFRRRKQLKLYRQWVKHSNLPADAIPQELISGETSKTGGEEKGREKKDTEKPVPANIWRIRTLYILLALVILVIIVAVSILAIQST